MRLIILSGLSGSGKSVALNTLEDHGFYCVDNLPTGVLLPLIETLSNSCQELYSQVAIGIDARSNRNDLLQFPHTIRTLTKMGVQVEIAFVHAQLDTLIRRFSETRRKHPLSQHGTPLVEAIEAEQAMLCEIRAMSDLIIDTSNLTIYQLRNIVLHRLLPRNEDNLSLLIQSFAFKKGVPGDSDYVFDVRCLPNPYWEPALRKQTGQDQGVIDYLSQFDEVQQMLADIRGFMERWIPRFQGDKRPYLSVSIGCTGGQHRSVFISESLHQHFSKTLKQVSLRHRELEWKLDDRRVSGHSSSAETTPTEKK